MKKYFISQPMGGKTEEAIRQERSALVTEIESQGDAVIDTVFPDFSPVANMPLMYLAKSLELLAQADVAIFMPGWDKARGCKIEHDCAVAYGVSVEYMS